MTIILIFTIMINKQEVQICNTMKKSDIQKSYIFKSKHK